MTNGSSIVGGFMKDKIEGTAVYLEKNGNKVAGLFSRNKMLKVLWK